MLIDCTTCVARDIACADCVVTVLLAAPPPAPLSVPSAPPSALPSAPPAAPAGRPDRLWPVDLDESEQAALGLLAQVGLVPPLRLVRPVGHGRDLSDTA